MDNFLLISLDCVRPEAISYYPQDFNFLRRVPQKAYTPNIDQIAADGTAFLNAFTQAPFTPASHASVFTGMNPYQHGIRSMFGCELRGGVKTMAEAFGDAGYRTGAFIGAHALATDYGLDKGFETYDDEFDDARKNWVIGNRRPGAEVTRNALEWLDSHTSDFFLFLHYFDAHSGGGQSESEPNRGIPDEQDGPSIHEKVYNRLLRDVDDRMGGLGRNLYHSFSDIISDRSTGIRYHLKAVQSIDRQLGHVITELKSRGLYKDTTVVVFADHGDAFGEHGEFGHRRELYDTTLRVPLIIKPPGQMEVKLGFRQELARLIDVFPTAANIHGIGIPDTDGHDLVSYTDHDGDTLRSYAETRCENSPADLGHPETDYTSLRTEKWKIIIDNRTCSCKLFHVSSDVGETNDVAEEFPSVTEDLVTQLDQMADGFPSKSDDINMSELPTVVDQLEGLGYL